MRTPEREGYAVRNIPEGVKRIKRSLWRNVIRRVEGLGRCIAPDPVGMGDSGKLTPAGPDRYTFAEHRRYLAPWLEALPPAPEMPPIPQSAITARQTPLP